MLEYPRELLIEILKEAFSQDSFYHYVYDQWGFAKTPTHKDLPLGAGINDNTTTRLYIGSGYRFDHKYYPSIIVKTGSSKSIPISMSRNKGFVEYSTLKIVDGYGNEANYKIPSKYVTSGAYEGNLSIDITTGDMSSRDQLASLITIMIDEIYQDRLMRAGVLFKPVEVGSPTEADDANDKLYKVSITCNIRTEWKREVPVESAIDVINFCIDFGRTPEQIAPNLSINQEIDFIDDIYSLFNTP